MSPSISVAMCTYNGARFLTEQLQSIAAQGTSPDELVVCDDGSSDETHEIVKEFARRCRFAIRFVANQDKLGSTKNFEKAISLCRGDIVALADQDDVWYNHKLASIQKTFVESRGTVATFSDADLIDERSRLMGLRLWSAFSFDAGEQGKFEDQRALEVLVKHPVVTGATMAFRRELFDLVTPIPSNHIHDRWISFLLAARGNFEAIREPLMQYRRHTEQQEGLPPQMRAELITQAKTRGNSFHLKEMRLLQEIHARLKEREADFPHAPLALIEIQRKVSHLALRAHLPSQRLARIPLVLRESFNLGYWRYSAGWNSIARDLMII